MKKYIFASLLTMPLMPLAAFKAYDGSLDPFTLTQAVRLVQMRQEVSAAKMKVGYPGVHHVPTAEELKWKLEEFPLCERKPVSIDGYYDMKTETVGYVEACSDKKPILFVGESIAEMMAENPADFEQTYGDGESLPRHMAQRGAACVEIFPVQGQCRQRAFS